MSKFSEDVTQIQQKFKGDIAGAVTQFSSNYKIILTDYPAIQTELSKLSKQVANLLEAIKREVPNDNASLNNILYKDDFISFFQELEKLKTLDIDFIKRIKLEFDQFLKDIDKTNIDKEGFKAFPGCYEKKEKSDDPYGDYIIYHEMLHYAKRHSCDVIFLTYDITKGDWMQKSKSPHLHYVENFYQNTDQMLYILDGERTFDDLDINFKSFNSVQDLTWEISIPIDYLWDLNLLGQQLREYQRS